MNKEVQNLLDSIKNIPGEKLIFVCNVINNKPPLSFSLDEVGNSENADLYSKCVEEITKMLNVSDFGGFLEVYSFLDDRKIIYGFDLGYGTWFSIPAEEMEDLVVSMDGLEPNVGFCNL